VDYYMQLIYSLCEVEPCGLNLWP